MLRCGTCDQLVERSTDGMVHDDPDDDDDHAPEGSYCDDHIEREVVLDEQGRCGLCLRDDARLDAAGL